MTNPLERVTIRQFHRLLNSTPTISIFSSTNQTFLSLLLNNTIKKRTSFFYIEATRSAGAAVQRTRTRQDMTHQHTTGQSQQPPTLARSVQLTRFNRESATPMALYPRRARLPSRRRRLAGRRVQPASPTQPGDHASDPCCRVRPALLFPP